MAPVDPHKRLMRRSAAYRAYIGIDALPTNAPGFEVDGKNQPKVYIAEHFCRVPSSDGTLCGKKHASRYLLDQHLRGFHKATPKNERHHNAAMIEAADEFYCKLMKGYEWPDYGEGEDDTSAASTLLKLEPRFVEVTDDEGEEDDASAVTAFRKQKSSIVETTNDDLESLGVGPEQQDPSRSRKRCDGPQKPQSSQSEKEQDLEVELKKIGIQKQMHATELREISIQKQIHAAELRELELEQALKLLKKPNVEESTA